MKLDSSTVHSFRELVWDYYHDNERSMPWRDEPTPYYVCVSEIMLQQTQVSRVIPKFNLFIDQFPTVHDLADASLSDVLIAWQGLGYNRRAKFLHQAAQMVENEYGGEFPNNESELVKLAGIGPNTAGAILAYAFEEPSVFIETNIRSVYFHHFFENAEMVNDAELREVVAATLDYEQPREWYWALMDYGSYLKSQNHGQIKKSRHYVKQSAFIGSNRQIRGVIIRALAQKPSTLHELSVAAGKDSRVEAACSRLEIEGLIQKHNDKWRLTEAIHPS